SFTNSKIVSSSFVATSASRTIRAAPCLTSANAFITHMEYAYTAADVVVARSGAMTIAELSVVGRASIFVPYPFAAEDHQAENALALVRQGAALMVRDADVATKLLDTILELVKDEKKIKELEVNILKNGNTKADEVIASEILKTIKN
ncbi:MAG: hypothetical protein M3R50_05590, partial [Bacteroidota bacterium]|nr:hypothetical protein [Bacteroidota bacterium]